MANGAEGRRTDTRPTASEAVIAVLGGCASSVPPEPVRRNVVRHRRNWPTSREFKQVTVEMVAADDEFLSRREPHAIERLGAKKYGVLRHYGVRRDGSPRDIVLYSILASEWPDVRRHLELRLHRPSA